MVLAKIHRRLNKQPVIPTVTQTEPPKVLLRTVNCEGCGKPRITNCNPMTGSVQVTDGHWTGSWRICPNRLEQARDGRKLGE